MTTPWRRAGFVVGVPVVVLVLALALAQLPLVRQLSQWVDDAVLQRRRR